jgi:DnaJ family protein A protein 2
MKHHPDKGGDPEKFKEITNAYDAITNPQPEPGLGGGGPGADFFSQMFGAAFASQRGPVRRADHQHAVTISLEDAYRGTTKHMKIGLTKTCFACQKKCPQCQGRGQIHVQMGPMAFAQPCPPCEGRGTHARGCDACTHRGHRVENLNLDLRIPAGIQDGEMLLGHGLGEQPRTPDEEPGDIQFVIRVASHPSLMRMGPDLVWSTKIPFEDSVRGCVLQVPHFDGPITIDTSDYGVLDPRKDYFVKDKGFVKGGRLRLSFDIQYPEPGVRFSLERSG